MTSRNEINEKSMLPYLDYEINLELTKELSTQPIMEFT
jgi:hypothetical protein